MTEVDIATGEIVHLPAGRLSPGEAADRTAWLRQVTKAALVEGTDYGIIPGTDRPSLLKPGAEMLLVAAGVGFTIRRIDDADFDARRSVTYRATVRDRTGFTLAECDGTCSYDESRYYRSAQDSERLERARAMKDRRPPKEDRFAEYKAPFNTLVKMAQKRALVGAALAAVAGSGLFATDTEDDDPPPRPPRPSPPRYEVPGGEPF